MVTIYPFRENKLEREPIEKFLKTDHGNIHFLDWGGTGPELHFLHANGFCAGTYNPLLQRLWNHFHIMASDIRGHGGSFIQEVPTFTHWRFFADDLIHFIEAEMKPPVIGIGHSLGAVTTLLAAARKPGLFSHLVLLDPVLLSDFLLFVLRTLRILNLTKWVPLARGARHRKQTFRNKEEAFRRFASGRGIFKSWSDDFIDAYLECGLLEKDEEHAVLKCDPELEARIFESVPTDIWKYISKISHPVLAIRGVHSSTFPEASAARLQKRISRSTILHVEGSGHFVPMEKPEICSKAILNFLGKQG